MPENKSSPVRAGSSNSELLFVIMTLTMLSLVISVNFIPVGEQTNRKLQRVGIDRVTQALDSYKSSTGSYPTKEEGLDVLWNQAAVKELTRSNWSGPYLLGPVKDRWGSSIIYQWPSEMVPANNEANFDLHSPGPDGKIHTSDDITNHDGEQLAEVDSGVDSERFSIASENTDAS